MTDSSTPGSPEQSSLGDEEDRQGPIIRDKRRIDPVTGQIRERPLSAAPATETASDGGGQSAGSATEELERQLAERTADVQRVQAEFLNYKRRVNRERENARAAAVASTLTSLLPVLDDIARAREHEELTGGFRAVAESFERTITSLGLTPFGQVGDEFDPRIHEALMHGYADDVDGPVCQAILQVGYRIGERVVRPARVAVAEPQPAHSAGSTSADPFADAVLVDEPAGDDRLVDDADRPS